MAKEEKAGKKDKSAKKTKAAAVSSFDVTSSERYNYTTVSGVVAEQGDLIAIAWKRKGSRTINNSLVPKSNVLVWCVGESGYIVTDHVDFADYAYYDVLSDVKAKDGLVTGKDGSGNAVTLNLAKITPIITARA